MIANHPSRLAAADGRRALVAPLGALLLALAGAGCVTPERPAAPGGATSAPATAIAAPPEDAVDGSEAAPTGAVTVTSAASGTLITEGTPVTIDLSGGAAGGEEGGAPVVVVGEPTVEGLALFLSDAVRPYAATITEASTLRDALARDASVLENPRWLGRAVEVAEQTRLAAQIIDTGLRGGRWDAEARPLAEEIDRNVVVPMVTSATAFLAAARGEDAERALDGLSGMSDAMDNLALAMQGLRDELLERQAPAQAEE